MKYLIRSIKYFIYFSVLLVVVMAVMVAIGAVDADIEMMFRHGYESLWQIALMLVLIAVTYPFFGFIKKETVVPGEYSEIRQGVIDFMEDRGYTLKGEDGENMVFSQRNVVNRFFRMFEDNITLTRSITGFTMEGLRKDVVRLSYGMEYRFRHPEFK